MGQIVYVDSKMKQTPIEELDVSHILNAKNKLERDGQGDSMQCAMLRAAIAWWEDNVPRFEDGPISPPEVDDLQAKDDAEKEDFENGYKNDDGF